MADHQEYEHLNVAEVPEEGNMEYPNGNAGCLEDDCECPDGECSDNDCEDCECPDNDCEDCECHLYSDDDDFDDDDKYEHPESDACAVIGHDAAYITDAGAKLIRELALGGHELHLTRVEFGTAELFLEDEEIDERTWREATGAHGLVDDIDVRVEGVTDPHDEHVALGVQINSTQLPPKYANKGLCITNFAIMARDPFYRDENNEPQGIRENDEANESREICYCYVSLHKRPQHIRPSQESVNTLARWLIYFYVSSVPLVEATINPDVLVTHDIMERHVNQHFEHVTSPAFRHHVDVMHNDDVHAHPWLIGQHVSFNNRLDEILSMFGGQGSAHFVHDFSPTLSGLTLTAGVWNRQQGRIEF